MKVGFERKGAGWRYVELRAGKDFLAHAEKRKALVAELADKVFRASASPEYVIAPVGSMDLADLQDLLGLIDHVARRAVEPGTDPTTQAFMEALVMALLFELGYPHILRDGGDADVRVFEACKAAKVGELTAAQIVALQLDEASDLFRHEHDLAELPVWYAMAGA